MIVISPETRMMELPCGEEIMIVGRTMWTQSTSVSDRQTDRQTDRITITDTVQTASHGKNTKNFLERGHSPLPDTSTMERGIPPPHARPPLGASGISTPPIPKSWVCHCLDWQAAEIDQHSNKKLFICRGSFLTMLYMLHQRTTENTRLVTNNYNLTCCLFTEIIYAFSSIPIDDCGPPTGAAVFPIFLQLTEIIKYNN